MKVKVSFTIEIDEHEFRSEYAEELSAKEIKHRVKSSAIESTMSWLGKIGVKASTNG